MRSRRRTRRPSGSGVVGPPPAFQFEREPFDPSGPISSHEWHARETARFKVAHAAYVAAEVAWLDHARAVLGVPLDGLDVFQAENAEEVWPDWSVIPADVRHLCTPDTPKETPTR